VTKTQSAGPISCLEHRATRVLHCAIVNGAVVLMFPLLLQTIISNQMRPRRLRGAWFSRLLRHPDRRQSGSILSPGTHTGSTAPLQAGLGTIGNGQAIAIGACTAGAGG